jgi:hypothetical protein
MNYFKSFFRQEKTFTLLTGGHLNYTKDILTKINEKNKNYIILHKDNTQTDNNINYDNFPNTQVFNCDSSKHEDIEELLLYLKDNKVHTFLS